MPRYVYLTRLTRPESFDRPTAQESAIIGTPDGAVPRPYSIPSPAESPFPARLPLLHASQFSEDEILQKLLTERPVNDILFSLTGYSVIEKGTYTMPRSNAQNEQMRAESRAKILATARHLFAEHGYDGCSVSDIAHQAGMSQGNIYWYFSSKEDLLKAVLAEAFEGLAALFEEVAATSGTGRERLDTLIQRYIEYGDTRGGAETTIIVASLTAQGGLKRLADLGVNTAQIGAGVGQAVTAIVAQAQAEGAIRPEINPGLAAVFFFSLFNGLVFTYRDEVSAIPREILHATALRLVGATES